MDILFLALDSLINPFLRNFLLKILCPSTSIIPSYYYELICQYLQSENFFTLLTNKIFNDKNLNGVQYQHRKNRETYQILKKFNGLNNIGQK